MVEGYAFEVRDGVAEITLDREARKNALTFGSYRALADLFHDLAGQEDVRAVILTGRGSGFCSGGDVDAIIGALQSMSMKEILAFTRMTGELIRNIRELDRPVIAAVNGIAAGAGAVIALASDFRVFAESAAIAFLFTKVGLTGADMGAALLLPRIVGLARATEILMLGERIPARAAEAMGLAHRVVADADVMTAARELAARLAGGASFAVRMTKRMLENEWAMGLGPALEAEAQAQALLIQGRDHREFYASWKEKRPPRFRGE